MFLLILSNWEKIRLYLTFTFHYVSTYTFANQKSPQHATIFTFHYVSTYTRRKRIRKEMQTNLHSTMFLLIPISCQLFPT